MCVCVCTYNITFTYLHTRTRGGRPLSAGRPPLVGPETIKTVDLCNPSLPPPPPSPLRRRHRHRRRRRSGRCRATRFFAFSSSRSPRSSSRMVMPQHQCIPSSHLCTTERRADITIISISDVRVMNPV